jgi:hypothetical protein
MRHGMSHIMAHAISATMTRIYFSPWPQYESTHEDEEGLRTGDCPRRGNRV